METALYEKGMTQKQLMKALGLPVSVFTQWKYDSGRSYVRYADQIAEILNMSRTYLLSGKEDRTVLTPREEEMFSMYRQLPDSVQESLIALFRSILSDSKKKPL